MPKGYRVGPIEERYLDYIRNIQKQSTSVHSGELSDKTQEILLKNFFSACMYNSESKPVTWGFFYLSGELLDGFTDPVYRGRGFGKPMNIFMEQEGHRRGQPHIHRLIATDNMASQSAVKSFLKPLPQIVLALDYVPHTKCKY